MCAYSRLALKNMPSSFEVRVEKILPSMHMFSLFINTLGAFAHTARLQFIEFFGKFYEADGVKFKPLAMNTDTVNVIDSGAE